MTNELLTAEQVAEIESCRLDWLDPVDTATVDRSGALARLAEARIHLDTLLRDREAICERLEGAEAKLAKVREGLEAVSDLIAASDGVYGLHHNGDGAPWDELRAGGRFEGWLADFDAAIAILENQS